MACNLRVAMKDGEEVETDEGRDILEEVLVVVVAVDRDRDAPAAVTAVLAEPLALAKVMRGEAWRAGRERARDRRAAIV